MFANASDAVPPLLPPSSRRLLALFLLAAHAMALVAWIQSTSARRALAEVAPVMVSLVADTATLTEVPPPALPSPVPPRPSNAPLPVPEIPAPQPALPTLPPAAARQVVSEPANAPSLATPAAAAVPWPAVVDVAAAPPAPAAPPPPRTVQISAVAYLQPPVLDYPLASRRQGEEGQVQVRVLIGPDGLPRQMSVLRSSGFARLDEAALAAVRGTRFRPYTENGQAVAVWVVIPLQFELQT